MTEYINLGKPDVSDLRVGDMVTMKADYEDAKPFEAEVWEGNSKILFAATEYLRWSDGDASLAWDIYVISVRRPAPALPTEPWSLVVPHNYRIHYAYALDSSGAWRSIGGASSSIWGKAHIASLLAAGTHYVKGTDQQIGQTAHQTEGETE